MRIQYLVTCWVLLAAGQTITVENQNIFDSLTTIEKYASSVEENPQLTTLDWENPDFSSYHKNTNLSVIKKLLYSLGLRKPLWNIASFLQLLANVTTEREYAGYKAPFIYKLEPIPGTTFIIFGELFGAFHSLVRDLRSLQQQGFIDEHLKIIEPDCYIIFNGNMASRSAYSLETLTVILRLLYVNKQSVFVTIGNQELDKHWQHYAIKRELKTRAASFQVERIPKGPLIEQFFNTIPFDLYLVAERTNNAVSVVRVSNVGFEKKDMPITSCGNFFNDPEQDIFSVNPKEQKKSTVEVTVRALIRGDPFFKTHYKQSQGLLPSAKEDGAVTWMTMSSPIQANQELLQFYYDAYVKLSTAQSLDNWTLTLYNRDVREYEKIKPSETVRLLSRQELNKQESIEAQLKIIDDQKKFFKQEIASLDKKIALQSKGILEDLEPAKIETVVPHEAKKDRVGEPALPSDKGLVPLGKKESTISVVSLIDLSSLLKLEGESSEIGIKAVFDTFNKKGELSGTLLDLITFDTQSQTELAHKQALQALEKDKTGLLLFPLSTGVLEANLDLIEKKQVLALFPAASGAGKLRNKELTNLFFMRASGQQESYEVTYYVASEQGGKRFALFYANNSFGKTSLQGAQEALKKLNVSDYISIPFEENNLDFTEQVKIIKQFNADSLGILTIQEAAKELLLQLGTKWLTGKKLFGTQDLSSRTFRKYIEQNQLKFVCTSVVPNPDGPLAIAEKYRHATEKMAVPNDIYCFEAYISADFFTHILKNISLPITSKKIIDFLIHIHNYNFNGLTLDFDPEHRQLLHSIWLINGEKDWKEIKLSRPPVQATQIQTEGTQEQLSRVQTTASSPDDSNAPQTKLSVGSVLDLSRGDAVLGQTVKKIMELLIDRANMHKQKDMPIIDLTVLDNEYSPEKARKAIETFLKNYNTNIILCPVGSQPYKSFIDYITKGDIITVFPAPGIPGKRFNLPNSIFLRPSYYDEARVLIRYCIEHIKPQHIVLLYQDDLFGQALLDGAKKELETVKAKYTAIPYARNLTNFSTQIKQIIKINPDAIALFTTPEAGIEFLRQLGEPLIKRIQFLGSSDLGTQVAEDFIKKNEINCINCYGVPDPMDQTLPLSKEFLHDMQQAHIKPDKIAFETYISTQIFLQVLSQIKGRIDKNAIIDAFEKIHNVAFKGLELNFDPNTRQLINTLWIDPGTQTPWIKVPVEAGDN